MTREQAKEGLTKQQADIFDDLADCFKTGNWGRGSGKTFLLKRLDDYLNEYPFGIDFKTNPHLPKEYIERLRHEAKL